MVKPISHPADPPDATKPPFGGLGLPRPFGPQLRVTLQEPLNPLPDHLFRVEGPKVVSAPLFTADLGQVKVSVTGSCRFLLNRDAGGRYLGLPHQFNSRQYFVS